MLGIHLSKSFLKLLLFQFISIVFIMINILSKKIQNQQFFVL